MRNKLILLMLLAVTTFISCDEEIVNYDNINGQTLVKFDEAAVKALNVEINNQGSVELTLTVSTVSTTDRTVNISLASSDIPEADLDFSDVITIPAGEYAGTFSLTVQDSGLAIGEEFDVVFNIDGLSGADNISIPSPNQTIRATIVCPVPDDFMVGEYEIADLNATVGPGNGTENFAAGVVNISVGESSTQRVFTSAVLPAFNSDIENIVINLSCDVFQLGEVVPGLACTTGVPYIFGPTSRANSGTYNVNAGDDLFVIEYVEDVNGSCGGPFSSSFILTKAD